MLLVSHIPTQGNSTLKQIHYSVHFRQPLDLIINRFTNCDAITKSKESKWDATWIYGYSVRSRKNGFRIFVWSMRYSPFCKLQRWADGSISPWWRYDMKTLPVLLKLCERNPPVNGDSPPNGPEMCNFNAKCWTNSRIVGNLSTKKRETCV